MLPWELDQSMRSGLLSTAFAEIWTSIPKLVFSRTLTEVQGNAALATRPVADELVDLRAANDAQTISVGGANLAAELAHHDLIDEYRLFVNPVIVGAGTRFFPHVADRLALRAPRPGHLQIRRDLPRLPTDSLSETPASTGQSFWNPGAPECGGVTHLDGKPVR